MSEQPTIHRIDHVEARVEDEPWPWAAARQEEIARHWTTLTDANPALYNGRVLVAAERRFAGATLHVRYRVCDYASFLTHRDLGFPDRAAGNCFGMAALRSADGAFLLGVMGQHTANAGRVYFPAGTPEPADVLPDGRVDLLGNVLRELTEETGLLPAEVRVEAGWTAVVEGGRTALMRAMTAALPANLLGERVRGFLAAERQPEFSDFRWVRQAADIDEAAVPRFVQVYLRQALAGTWP